MSLTVTQLTHDHTRPQGALFLCHDERGIEVGHLFVEAREWPLKRRSLANYAEITTLRVAERHQRKGVGRALVAAAREWAKRHGYEALSVEAKQPCVAFYEAVGLVARTVILEQALTDAGASTEPDIVAAASENPRS